MSAKTFSGLHKLHFSGRFFIGINFGNDGMLVYDIDLKEFYLWGRWVAASSSYTSLDIGCSELIGASGYATYVGSNSADKIYYLTQSSYLDDTDKIIRTVLQTDFIDRGAPDQYKYCHELTLVFKRANIASGTPKTISVSYRDEGSETWSTETTVGIEAVDTTDLKSNIRMLGRYKRRMWRFVMADSSDAALLEVRERFDIGN
jgi:hypothetical protein